ncbi:MAG: hypothetical protein IH984_16060 [Planctomycetes bacterium]|nr:hypothetical protein [Planctomycetota bacterium]
MKQKAKAILSKTMQILMHWLTRRALLRVLVSVFLGLITTIVVAWGFADLMVANRSTPKALLPVSHLNSWSVDIWHRTGAVTVSAMISGKSSDAIELLDSDVPRWSRVRFLPAYRQGEPMPIVIDYAYGWPMLSMWYSKDAKRDWQTGTVISQRTSGTLGNLNLPTKIIVWGFVGDVIFFALLFLLGLIVVKSARRRWRIQKGKCPICCYNLRSDFATGCPECGWQRAECDSVVKINHP